MFEQKILNILKGQKIKKFDRNVNKMIETYLDFQTVNAQRLKMNYKA